ncbi:DUF2631 domain-containing protein [Mycolicibacterium sediminis]|uniref:DUF2631 domain-containing protein n=1 Tax=Mycolicibacterium sediminis TaxID=1286180 RepID=A0A7I7QTK8_9MYCO|nr:DUF2631 domain-containing protein [Mycolicibacterium sediminis]BBY29350.1 hypothetical protein MSEDJ_34460 [Mycolicibacterium sediminis]
MANTEVERYNGVDVEDVPSANWGWSKENPRIQQIGGIVVGLFLLAMLHGNHTGKVEDIFLIFFAVVVFGVVIRYQWLRKRGFSR